MMAQTVSARPPIWENATVEKIPIAPITINAPAYQSKCAASNFTTAAAAFAGAAGWRLLKNVVNRSRSAALITRALTASRRSSSDHCIAVVSFCRTIAKKPHGSDYQLVINFKTAKALGLDEPMHV